MGTVDVTTVLISDCVGLWRRTLLIEADGSRDTGADVRWLQGITAYVDSRGFAGRLDQDAGIFQWHRVVDLEPPGPPDAGEMRWEGPTLVETGVHADYVEHWMRDDGAQSPRWAVFLVGPDGEPGLLVRVGARFGFAGRGVVVIGDVDGPQWTAIEIGEGHVQADGVRWIVEETEGRVNS